MIDADRFVIGVQTLGVANHHRPGPLLRRRSLRIVTVASEEPRGVEQGARGTTLRRRKPPPLRERGVNCRAERVVRPGWAFDRRGRSR
jgi:hypothetical protein